MRKAYRMMAIALAVASNVRAAETLADLPVSATANVAYLTAMKDRPWWNKAWKKRAAILVSNMTDLRIPRTTVDFVFEVGEKVDPKSVRIVTPWETPVDCQASDLGPRTSATAVRLLFQTELREGENRPFLVYWDNPSAEVQKPFSPIVSDVSTNEIRVSNGAVEIVFDRLHATPGLVKSLRATTSKARTDLLWRTTGYAWQGFEFTPGGKWSAGAVTEDNAFRKTVTFTNENAELDFTLFAYEPRVDYAYRLKPGVQNAGIAVSWAPGEGCANDDFYYVGTAGKMLTFRAALDEVTDCMPQHEFYGFPWISEGWYAIRDRVTRDVVGLVFDRAAFGGMWYLAHVQASGERVPLTFRHNVKKDECAAGKGALVVSVGETDEVVAAHKVLAHPPKVFVSSVQSYREIPVKVPVLDRDFCVNVNVGGWSSSAPLDVADAEANVISHIRALGANTILLGQLTDFGWQSLPVSTDLYARVSERFKGRKLPAWTPENFNTAKLKRRTAEAHRQGLAVCTWHDGLGGLGGGELFSSKDQALLREIQALYPKCGVDSTFNSWGGGEAVPVPKGLDLGGPFWNCKDPEPFFASRRQTGAFMKEFYDYAHKANPGTKVMVFNSDNSELGREMCMSYFPGVMDTLFCEFCANCDFTKVKHVAKRLRGYFDNVDAKTIHAHYFFMKKAYAERIGQCEMPFCCGINGFSQESMTYENVDRDMFEITADFNRFMLQTKLGEKVAKMGPVKNLAVFRDMDCFEEDCRRHRTLKRSWWNASRHDARVNAFAEIPSYNYDVVINPYFKAESLKRYKAVYIPDDEVLSEANAKELLAYVKAGGGAVVEGATREKVEKLKSGKAEELGELKDGRVVEYGRGRIVWTKEVLTDPMLHRDAKAIARARELIAAVGGQDPLTIESKSLDGVLQSGAEGMFLGVYNRGDKEDTGKVALHCSPSPSTFTSLFVLDVKRGVRFAYTNGFEIAVGPRQCGFYLIGDDDFTALPEAKETVWTGAAATSDFAAGSPVQKPKADGFVPKSCVEYVHVHEPDFSGDRSYIRRSHQAGLTRLRFCPPLEALGWKKDFRDWLGRHPDVTPFNAAEFSLALDQASYVHFVATGEECEIVFERCVPALKNLLKRGGGILVDRFATGPKAQAFFREVGVFDPSPTLRKGIGGGPVWDTTFPTNHPFLTANKTVEGWKNGGWYHLLKDQAGDYGQAYTKWDAKQLAPFRTRTDASATHTVIQDKVLGAGKVAFCQNSRAFNDWYEMKTYGDSVLSWLIGMSVREHADKVKTSNGGFGEVVR